MHFRRVMIEQFGQALTIGAGLIDRVVLTGVLVRIWGDARFEVWSVCLAAAGLISLFDFGFGLYFNNRLMEEFEQNRLEDAKHTLFVSNTIFCAVGSLGFLGVVALSTFSSARGLQNEPTVILTVWVLAASSALRIAATGFLSLYRANRQYARLAFFYAAGETTRIAGSIIACLLGGGLLVVALVGTLLAVLLQVIVPVIDAVRRFHPHRIGFALMPRGDVATVFLLSSGFFAQAVPVILLTSLPVLYLGQMNLGAGALATFVLMRTLSGLPRALLQQFGMVLGQECGRRVAVDDNQGALKIVGEGARLYSVLSGVAAGLVLSAGLEVVLLWTGSREYFEADYLAAAISPMLLGAFAVLAHNILTATNAPFFAAAGRWAQLALTALVTALLPVQDLALTMLIALSLGEVLGFAPLAYYGVARLVPGTSLWFHTKEILVSIGVAILATALTQGVLALISPATLMGRGIALAMAVMVNALLIPWIGVRSRTRQAVIEHFVHPRLLVLGSVVRAIGRQP